jgi:hypothetical protein
MVCCKLDWTPFGLHCTLHHYVLRVCLSSNVVGLLCHTQAAATQRAVLVALADDFDTPTALNALRRLMADTNEYRLHTRHANAQLLLEAVQARQCDLRFDRVSGRKGWGHTAAAPLLLSCCRLCRCSAPMSACRWCGPSGLPAAARCALTEAPAACDRPFRRHSVSFVRSP